MSYTSAQSHAALTHDPELAWLGQPIIGGIENWPLIGPLDGQGAFLVGALSGFGSMSACAAGSLCADWLFDGPKPEYAHALSLARYQDPMLMKQLAQTSDVGIL